jgi:hypothetical protein
VCSFGFAGHASSAEGRNAYVQLPLTFEANQGQTDPQVAFLARGSRHALFLTRTEAVLVLQHAKSSQSGSSERSVVRMKPLGARSDVRPEGLDVLPGRVNYLLGSRSEKWRSNVTSYARVRYRDVYPGVDLIYYGHQGELEYDFVVAPGADPSAIRLGFDGADLSIDDRGDLTGTVGGGEVRLERPVIYQARSGRRQFIPGEWILAGPREARFRVGEYDSSLPLVIDPVLSYSTYLGAERDDQGAGIAVDIHGSAYVTGYTTSTAFPATAGSFQQSNAGPGDVFVTKLDRDGSTLVYSTYVGGTDDDAGASIALDFQGHAYVAGSTNSADFPTTAESLQPHAGVTDAFVMKLDRTGSSLIYSTFLGGTDRDDAVGIAVDLAGQAYVAGTTASIDFPTSPGAVQSTSAGTTDGFIAKLNRAGSALRYSTYLGSSGFDFVADVAVDLLGHAYVTGGTRAANFPTTPGALRATSDGLSDEAFVTKLDRTGSSLVYSTYLGGTHNDFGAALAVDVFGRAYVTGGTSSADFPTTPGAFQATVMDSDAYVVKLDRSGSSLVYSTLLGGSGQDWGNDIAIDIRGHACVTGTAGSTDFPTANAVQDTAGGQVDAFVTKFDRGGTALVYSTYLGGSDREDGVEVALDIRGRAYVVGMTSSIDMPTTTGAFQNTFGGDRDGFVAKIDDVVGQDGQGAGSR